MSKQRVHQYITRAVATNNQSIAHGQFIRPPHTHTPIANSSDPKPRPNAYTQYADLIITCVCEFDMGV